MKSAGSLNFFRRSQNHFLKTFDYSISRVSKNLKPEVITKSKNLHNIEKYPPPL
jgi:hypothetical protein